MIALTVLGIVFLVAGVVVGLGGWLLDSFDVELTGLAAIAVGFLLIIIPIIVSA